MFLAASVVIGQSNSEVTLTEWVRLGPRDIVYHDYLEIPMSLGSHAVQRVVESCLSIVGGDCSLGERPALLRSFKRMRQDSMHDRPNDLHHSCNLSMNL